MFCIESQHVLSFERKRLLGTINQFWTGKKYNLYELCDRKNVDLRSSNLGVKEVNLVAYINSYKICPGEIFSINERSVIICILR